MKRIKILITLLISLFIIFGIQNICFAEYNEAADIEQMLQALNDFEKENPGTAAVGRTFKIGLKTMIKSDSLYCIAHNQWLLNPTEFKVVKYIQLNGSSASIPGTNLETINNYNAILGQILSGRYGYGYGDRVDINVLPTIHNDAQKALWTYWSPWLDDQFWNRKPGQGELTTSRAYFGFDDSWGSKAYQQENQWDGILNDLMNEVSAAYQNGTIDTWNTRVDLYFLEVTSQTEWHNGELWAQSKPFQKLIIAIPQDVENPDLQIIKVDADTGKNLPKVVFTVKNNTLGKYISEVTEEGSNTFKVTGYSAIEDAAVKFTTGTDTYQDIIIKELPAAEYTIKEIENGNSGYEDNKNKEWPVKVEINGNNVCKIEIKNGDTPPPPPPPPPPDSKPYSGEATISGTVWEDSIDASKNNIGNSLLDSGESGIEGVRVTWYTTGREMLAYDKTDSNGYYSLSYEIPMYTCNYYESPEEREALEKVNNSYLEFEFNGLKYTTVATNINLSNGSKAAEDPNDRLAIDQSFDEVTGQGVMNGNHKAYDISYIRSQMHTSSLDATNSDFAVTASTNRTTISNLLDNYLSDTTEKYLCINHHYNNFGTHCMEDTGYWSDCGHCLDEYKDGKLVSSGCVGDDVWNHTCMTVTCGSEHCGGGIHTSGTDSNYWKNVTVGWHIEDMNLGLIKKEQVKIGLTSDIEEVKVISRGQVYTYKYNYRDQLTDDQLYNYQVKFEDKDNINQSPRVYRRPVNPADVATAAKDMKELEIYVTYKIKAKNLSNTLTAYIQEIVNYYDAGYSLSAESNAAGWSTTSKYGHTSQYLDENEPYGRFGAAYYQLDEIDGKLEPQKESTVIKVQYKVTPETVKKLVTQSEVPLNNISEICSYSTFYGADTICAGYLKASECKPSKVGTPYASIDEVAIPENAVPGNKDTYERDTDIAPTFGIIHDDYKIISGTVWEDLQTNASKNSKERLGNGIKDASEKGVANVKVELLRVDEDENGVITLNTAYLYNIETQAVMEEPAITYTDENGNYTFGSNEDGSKKGVSVDKYVIRYTYGNKVSDGDGNIILANGATKVGDSIINARNYKSTLIITDLMKDAIRKTELNNSEMKVTNYTEENSQWHLKVQNGISTAIDDIGERLKIDSLKYSNFDSGVNMSAYSGVFEIQVEYENEKTKQVNVNGEPIIENDQGDLSNFINEEIKTNFITEYSTFDFGIIKRPQEDIVVETIVSNLKIVLADGQILTEGDPYKERMQYVKAVGSTPIKTRNNVKNAKNKLISLEIDQELIQGARIDLLYTTTITNNSEYDYEYNPAYGGNNQYYYFGNKEGLPLLNKSVEKVVNYLDKELIVNENESINKVWTSISAKDLFDQGYISEKTYNTVKDNYTIFTTDKFVNLKPGQFHTELLSASKLLANQATEYTYENHVEIIELNGQSARTIEADNTGKQIAKTYKVGNYIPSLTRVAYNAALGSAETPGFHQQDDDMIKITITPPTGSNNHTIIYIATIAIGMISLGYGIMFIKKRIL